MKKLVLLILLCTGLSAQAQKQKVIFDCDLGGDIDDAFALALLLTSQEEFEILGLCMDHGDTEGRGRIASKILYQADLEDIPVYLGKHTPNVVGKDTALAGPSQQYMWAEDFRTIKPKPQPAHEFIIETLNKFPDEVILFTVGPVDNIEDVLDVDPKALKKAKKVVSMFGSVKYGYGLSEEISDEWNVRANIRASQKLMNSGADLLLAPLDVTAHVILNDKYLNAIAMRDTPMTDALGALYALWYKHADWANHPVMFDGVAIGMVLWPELFETTSAHIYVDENGFTRIDGSKKPNCEYGSSINKDEFLLRMSRRILEQDFKR